jgi:hypothetical protein
MKKELDEYLCKTYPKMMVNRNKPMTETTMCWGFECGDGWFTLLDQLMGNIQHHIDWKNRGGADAVVQVTLDQVKEKFGTLRFYYTGGDDYIDGLVRMAESMSGVICEECGKPGTQTSGGWIKTVCKEHGGEDYDTPEEELNEDQTSQ